MLKFRIILFWGLILGSITLFSQTRYWVAGVASNWSGDNWSSTSGGAADGGGPPTIAQSARFDGNGLGNCTVDLLDPTISGLALSGYTGTIDLNGNTITATGTSSFASGTINDTPGTDSLVVTSAAATTFSGTTFGAIVHVSSSNPLLNGSVFNARSTFIKTGGGGGTCNGGNIFNATTIITHNGAGGNWIFANVSADDFNGPVTISNTGTGTTFMAHRALGNTFDGNIILNGTSGGGVYFGNNSGSSTFAAGFSTSIGALGFSAGVLRFREFVQLGATAQNLTLTGVARLDMYNATWGGDVSFTSPRFTTRESTYSGTSLITKSGATNDASTGGNRFTGNVTLVDSGSGYLLFGESAPDTCDADLTLTNTGTNHIYFGRRTTGNVVGGSLTATNLATGGGNYIYIGDLTTSGLSIAGDATLTNSGSATDCRILFGNSGDVALGGNLTATNNATGAAGYIQIANGSASAVSITGNTVISNSGGSTTKRVYLGNDGDVSLGGTVSITNSSSATNSEVYLNRGANSVNTYAENITLEVTNASTDGVYFGEGGGAGTLAATKTVSIVGGGFVGSNLYFRNFTQLGATAQSLVSSSTATIFTSYDCSWGGNVTFSAGRMILRGSVFSGTASFTKTGAGDDQSAGSNTFTGDVSILNSGSGYFMMGNGGADAFGGNLNLTNTGTNHIYIAQNSAGNTIAGNLVATNSGTGNSYIIISNGAASSLTISGTATMSNAGTGTNSRILFGEQGDITLNSDLTLSNTASATASILSVGNNTNSTVTINGNVSLTGSGSGNSNQLYIGNVGDVNITGNVIAGNDGTANSSEYFIASNLASAVSITGTVTATNSGSGATRRVYFGNQGDVTFGGDIAITNSSDATNSDVYFHNNSNSANAYNGNIVIENTNAGSDGFSFGTNGGSGTLAAGRTISIGAGGFNGRVLILRNFTQLGATAQTLQPTGATIFTVYDCSWGGNVVFSAPRITTRGTIYSGTASLTKNGATDDQSVGGNTFTGNATLTNTGSGYFMMGNGSPDTFGGDVNINNTGSRHIYLANNSLGNTIAGDLDVINNGSGDHRVYLASAATSDLAVTGATTVLNSGAGTTSFVYVGDQGDVTLGGGLTMTNTASSTSNTITVGNNTNSAVSITGNVSAVTTSTGNVSQFYIGNSGDVSISGNLIATQNSTATSVDYYIGNNNTSVVTIGGTTNVTNNGSGTTKRIYLGNAGDVTFTGDLSIINTSDATNSEVYCHHNPDADNTYSGNIVMQVTNANCDGIYFGERAGEGTLAATRTISIGGGGFLGRILTLRNFTQLGATAQTLQPTGNTLMTLYDSNWGGNVIFSSERMLTRGTVYSGTSSLTKTGATDDRSAGGNTFTGDANLNNSGSGFFMMGNGNPDVFGADLNITNTGSRHIYLANNSTGNTIAGDFTVTNTGTGNSSIFISDQPASTLAINGATTLINNGTGSNCRIFLGNQGDVTVGGDFSITSSPSGNEGFVYVGDDATSSVSIGGNTTVTNSGSNSSKRIYLGNQGDVVFNGNLNITNSSNATTSFVYCNDGTNSMNQYNGNIVLEVTHADCDGVIFGNGGGSGTLAATRTITIGGGGFIAGFLTLRNFTQVGPTAQTLEPTGTSIMTIYDSNWGGDIVFSSPRLSSRGTVYSGTTLLTKNGATDDGWAGGNTFTGNSVINNSGSGYIRLGDGNPDAFGANLSLNNTGSRHIYLAYNSAGNTIAGNLTATNLGTGTSTIYLSTNASSTLAITGSATLTNSGSGGDCNIYFGDDGDLTLTGNLLVTNAPTGAAGEIRLANNTNSQVTITGNTTTTNDGIGNTKRLYLGNNGDVTFSGTLSISNNSSANNSQVFCNYTGNSSNLYQGNIVLEVTHANCDGILFGGSNGSGTLSATRTVSIGGGGYIAGSLYFRNFTQIGPTAQTLHPTGTTSMVIYDSNWGGDIDFSAPRISTRGTTYLRTASLEKTGGSNDNGEGGNTFVGNATLINSGSGEWRFGNTSLDIFSANVDITNSGTNNFRFAQSNPGHSIAGNLTATNTVTNNGTIYLSGANSATLNVGGDVSLTNNCSGPNCNIYFGDGGDITVTGNVTAINSASGNAGELRIANGGNSTVSIGGNTTVSNSGAGTAKRIYLGNQGDITFSGTLSISNSSSANNSQVYSGFNTTSSVTYSNNISLEVTHANCDGIFFGSNAGTGTLAATRTVSIGAGGFIAGQLFFRNFTQVGATAQTLEPTGTTLFTNYDSDWGGNVVFSAPRFITRGTDYRGTAIITKNGAVDDQSVGGNTFFGNTVLNNSGSGYFLMGNGTSDAFNANLAINNTGSRHFYLAYNSLGNTVGGTLDILNSASGTTFIYLAQNVNSSLTVTGATSITNTASGGDSRVFIGENGDIVFNDDLNITNSSSSTSNHVYLAQNANSLVTIAGNTSVTHSSSGTTGRIYLGNSGDVNYSGNLTISNAATATNSQVYLNHAATSVGAYGGNIVLESTDALSDGVLFGNGTGTGTLAAGGTISIGGGGFIAGDLYFRNFTQVGATAQTLEPTGTTIFTNYDALWGGNVVFTSPRFTTRGTSYSGTAVLSKTGAIDDVSAGGNTFDANTTLNNSGSGYFLMGNNFSDAFNANLAMNNTGSRHMYLAHNTAGNTVAGDLTVNNTGTGTSYIYFATSAAASLSVGGASVMDINGTGNDLRIYIADGGDVIFGGDLTVNNSPSGNSGFFYFGDDGSSSAVVNGNTIYTQSGVGNARQAFIGDDGDITFNGDLTILNNSASPNSHVYCNYRTSSSNTYNGNIVLEATSASSDGILFGRSTGTGTLTAGNTISIGGGGFVAGDLYFRNFSQVGGGTTHNLTVTGTTITTLYDCNWGGDVTFNSPRITTRGGVYDGVTSITKTASGDDNSVGGNTFNGSSSFTNSSTSRMRLSSSLADDFNGDVSYIKTSTGSLEPAYNGTSTYAGNINLNTNTAITFSASNGVVEIDGAAAQSINDLGTTAQPNFRRLVLNNTADELTLNTPITANVSLTMTAGNILTTDANLLTLNDNISVTGTSDDSYVRGPVEKVGNDVFTFPVGDGGLYRPIAISAPSGGTSRFRATYFEANPDPTYTYNLRDPSLNNVSSREYWILDRTSGSSSVNVTLSWNTNSGGVGNLSELRVARWDGSLWRDHGNGGVTGNVTTGTVVSSAPIGTFSPFTLASTTPTNALPIELISFDAERKNKVVELKWKTATEINNDYFTIERSIDGKTFEVIEMIKGAGNSTVELSYATIDPNPYDGVSYYRLKQTDFDGQFEYFNVVSVGRSSLSMNETKVYPNPLVGQQLNVELLVNNNLPYEIELVSLYGERMIAEQLSPQQGVNKVTLNLNASIASGSYILLIKQGQEILHREKVIVR